MATSDRKKKHFEMREERLISVARELVRDEGILALQMTKLAEKCEYSVGTLYQHFSSKEDLLLAIAQTDIENRAMRFEGLAAKGNSSRYRMMTVALANAEDAELHEGRFDSLQFVHSEPVWALASGCRRQRVVAANQRIFLTMKSIVRDAVSSGDLDIYLKTDEELVAQIWALTIGMRICALSSGRGIPKVDRPLRVVNQHLRAFFDAINWRPTSATQNAGDWECQQVSII